MDMKFEKTKLGYLKHIDEEMKKRSKTIFPELDERIKKYFNQKFSSGRKSFRTGYAQDAFGKYYPREAYPYSWVIDIYTAAMDDLYDDSNAPDLERKLNVLGSNKSVIAMLSWPEILRNEAILHLQKMLIIGLGEAENTMKLKTVSEESEAIDIAKKCYFIRAIDMDFAVRIPSIYLNLSSEEIESIENSGRCFRAVNLCKKDINDVDHDRKHETETPITIFLDKEFEIDELKSSLLNDSLGVLEEIIENAENEIVEYVSKNFYRMCKD